MSSLKPSIFQVRDLCFQVEFHLNRLQGRPKELHHQATQVVLFQGLHEHESGFQMKHVVQNKTCTTTIQAPEKNSHSASHVLTSWWLNQPN